MLPLYCFQLNMFQLPNIFFFYSWFTKRPIVLISTVLRQGFEVSFGKYFKNSSKVVSKQHSVIFKDIWLFTLWKKREKTDA